MCLSHKRASVAACDRRVRRGCHGYAAVRATYPRVVLALRQGAGQRFALELIACEQRWRVNGGWGAAEACTCCAGRVRAMGCRDRKGHAWSRSAERARERGCRNTATGMPCQREQPLRLVHRVTKASSDGGWSSHRSQSDTAKAPSLWASSPAQRRAKVRALLVGAVLLVGSRSGRVKRS